jgi:Uma2 family endonuclease
MANAELKQPTTLDEFLDWEERQPERHEFVDGRIHAMAGGTRRHDRLSRQVANALEDALGIAIALRDVYARTDLAREAG